MCRFYQWRQMEKLVLGAWGSGVFGNQTEEVCGWFKAALNNKNVRRKMQQESDITEIVFAIPDREKVDVFRKVFGG